MLPSRHLGFPRIRPEWAVHFPDRVIGTNNIKEAQGLLSDARVKIRAMDMAALNAAVMNVGGTTAAVTATLEPLQKSADQVQALLPFFLYCQEDERGVGNKSCVQIWYADLNSAADRTMGAISQAAPIIAKSTEKTSAAVAQAAPSFATSAAGLAAGADDIGKTADKMLADLTKPKTLRQKVEAWVKLGVYAAVRFL